VICERQITERCNGTKLYTLRPTPTRPKPITAATKVRAGQNILCVHLMFVLAHVCFAHITISTAVTQFCRAAGSQRSTDACGTQARTGTVPRQTGSFRLSCPFARPWRAQCVDLRKHWLRVVSATGPLSPPAK